MRRTEDYQDIVAHYESCLALHGDNHRGVDWPNAEDAARRYEVMLDIIRPGDPLPVRVLDFGCGAAHLLAHIHERQRSGIEYLGLDISPAFIKLSRRKFPDTSFLCTDVLTAGGIMPEVDYVIMNGVFTEKRSLTFDAMFDYMRQLLKRVYPQAKKGLAFNVMSKHVDWEREDLFHLPYDALATFLKREISRHFVLRADYGLYEYAAYVYR